MALWPLDLAQGVRQALGSPGVDSMRNLLAAMCASGEGGGLFTLAGTDVRLVAAFPTAEPFETPAVRRLAEDLRHAPETEPVVVRESTLGREWRSALALPIAGDGQTSHILVLLARASRGVSALTRTRATLVAPVLALVAELDLARTRARQAEAQVGDVRQMLRLAKPGRDLDDISQELLDLAARLVDADLGGLWLRARRGADLELRAARPVLGRRPPRPTLAAGEVAPLVGTAPLSCPPSPLGLPRQLLDKESIGAAIVAPVHHEGELMGLLVVARIEGRRPFGRGEAQRLHELAELAALPVAKVCLRQELHERTRQLRASRRVAKGISASLSLERIFRVASHELRRVAAFDAAAIVALDESGEYGQVIAGEAGKAPEVFAWSPELRETVTGGVMRTRRAAFTADIGAAGRPVLPCLRELPGPRAAITLPLLIDGETVGALVLVSRSSGRFRRADVRLLRLVAEQLAIALRQARLIRAATAGLEDRLRLEARLRRAEHHATLGRLAGALAHDIRNPLTVVATTVQYLRDRLPPEHEHRALLDAADRKVREMDESLEGLITLSRPLELRPKPVEAGALLEAAAEAVRGRAGRQSVEVTVAAEPHLPPAALDPRLMEQAMLNLALSGLDGMPGGGRLVFGARLALDSGGLVLTVSDTGPGGRDVHLGDIFEPYPGSRRLRGLGLAVTRRIVEEHGGTIEASSEPGRGTTFVIALPAGGAAARPAHE